MSSSCHQYFNQNVIIDNLRTEVLSMNERRLIYPGPGCSDTNETVYPYGTCDQPVTWQERGIVSDTCNQWYHISCQSMQTKSYLEHANDSAIALDCVMCNCPNYSTFCYSLVFSSSNQFSLSSNTSINSTTPVDINPLHTSTPERETQKKK